MKNVIFRDVNIKGQFICNGTHWVKRSTRTAALFGQPSRWFYFSDKEPVQAAEKWLQPSTKKGIAV